MTGIFGILDFFFFQAYTKLRKAEKMIENLQAAQRLLKVPTAFDLAKPVDVVQPSLLGNVDDVSSVPYRNRWILYRYWANKFVRDLAKNVDALLDDHGKLKVQHEEARGAGLVELMSVLDVVGMTTCGAARNAKLIQQLASKVG
jgi:hypothetical protein